MIPSMESANAWARMNQRLEDLQRDFAAFKAASGTLGSGTLGAGKTLKIAEGGEVVAVDTGSSLEHRLNRFGFTSAELDPGTGGDLYTAELTSSGLLLTDVANGWSAVIGLDPATGQLNILSSVNGVTIGHTTLGSAANAILTTGGLLIRSTSSRRYKQDIEDVQINASAVLGMRPRTWRDKNAVQADPDTTTRNVGFIAEELDELGLGIFVDYDDEGRPDAIQYDRLAVGLLELAKAQQAQLAELAARLEALEAS